MRKKAIFLVALAAFLLLVYNSQSAKDVPIEDIQAKVEKKCDLSAMVLAKDRDYVQFLAIDPNQTKGCFYYRSKEALGVEELVVVKTEGNNQLSPYRDAFEKRIEGQLKTFESYGPEQVSLLKNATIVEKGPYILFYVGPDSNKVEEVFRRAI